MLGVTGRPLFTRPAAVWHHCKGCTNTIQSGGRASNNRGWRGGGTNNDARRGGQQRHLATAQGSERDARGKGVPRKQPGHTPCSDFYAGPVIPQGAHRGPQYPVTEPEEDPMLSVGAALFTPPRRCAKAERPEQHPWLPRLWICLAHRHRQCTTCAAVGRGVRHCCARGHVGHPRPSAQERSRGAALTRTSGAHTPGTGVGGGGSGV